MTTKSFSIRISALFGVYDFCSMIANKSKVHQISSGEYDQLVVLFGQRGEAKNEARNVA